MLYQYVLLYLFFLLLSSTLQCAYTTIYLSVHKLMDICIIYSLGLFWIMLWTFMFKSLCEQRFSFLLGKYPGVVLLNQKTGVYLPLQETSDLSLKRLYHFAFLPAVYESSRGSTFLPILSIFSIFNFSHSSGYIMLSHCGFSLYFPNN